jgi:methionine-rich copper-binding protein CopC
MTTQQFRGSGIAVPVLAVWLGLLALMLDSAPAWPHAIIVAARPAMNSVVRPGELEIRLDFNSRIDPRRSRLTLQQPDGAQVPVVLASHDAPNALAGRAQATMPGRWKLQWQVLSLDGHITRGEVNFSVTDKPLP